MLRMRMKGWLFKLLLMTSRSTRSRLQLVEQRLTVLHGVHTVAHEGSNVESRLELERQD
jgi:hypothetical protein